MKRTCFALTAMLGIFALCSVDVEAYAQKKDDVKKVDPKDIKKEPAKEGPGSIEVYKGKNGFRYRILDAEGKTVAMPLPNASWETPAATIKAIEDLKATLNKAKPVEVKE